MENWSISSLLALLLSVICMWCVCQRHSDPDGSFRMPVHLMKAVCIQTQDFADSNNLQLALTDPTRFSEIQDGKCRLVSCTKRGGKCIDIAVMECKKKPGGNDASKMDEHSKKPNETAKRVRYDGYKVYALTPHTEADLKALFDLHEKLVVFFELPSGINRTAVAALSPKQLQEFHKVRSSGLQMEEITADLQKEIDAERVKKTRAYGDMTWDAYYDADDISEFLDKIAKNHPDTARLIRYGKSFQKRDLLALAISDPKETGPKLIYFIECNFNSREWIATAVCTYLINDLLVEKKSCAVNYLKRWDFYIIPIPNPDGYHWSHTSGDRLWVKTRSRDNFSRCIGVNPDMNFDFQWGTVIATLNNPCSDYYPGRNATSEIEVKSILKLVDGIPNNERLRVFLSMQSYGLKILWPYSHTTTLLIPENALYNYAGQEMATAMFTKYSTPYTFGPAAITAYPGSGTSFDYFYEKLLKKNIYPTFSFAIKLRPEVKRHGFVLPANQIIPCSRETIDAICTSIDVLQRRKSPSCEHKKLHRKRKREQRRKDGFHRNLLYIPKSY